MRRTFIAVALALAAAKPTAAQPQSRCPVARTTLVGALIGFGAGVVIGSPVGAPLGGNVFEDTADSGQKMWFTVGLFTVTGAVVGHVLARRRCGAQHRPNRPAPIPLSQAETERLARRVRLNVPADGNPQWTRPPASSGWLPPASLSSSGSGALHPSNPVGAGSRRWRIAAPSGNPRR